jgi:uncharacterized protein YgfB (UPF0149 family)
MIQTPAFKAHLQPLVIPHEGVLLFSQEKATALYGRLYEKVAPLVDGVRNADEIAAALSGEMDAAGVYYTLMLLENHGCIAESLPAMEAGQAAFWHGLGLDPEEVAAADAADRVLRRQARAAGRSELAGRAAVRAADVT